MNFNKKDAVTDTVNSILQQEEEKHVKMEPHPKDALHAKLIDKVEGPTPEETPARKSVKAHGGEPVPQPKMGVGVKKESVTLKGFKTRYEEYSLFDQMINEVLSKDASAGKWIHDFVNSDNPKFAGKSKEQRKKQALAAYYAKQRNEEVEQIDELSTDTMNRYRVAARKASTAAVNTYGTTYDDHFAPDYQKRKAAAQPIISKREAGYRNAGSKIMKRGDTPSGVREDVEQIDELSKTTLKNYVDAAKQDNKEHADSRRSGDTTESRWAKDRMVKRNTGMGAAAQRLNKEESEQVEEGWDDMVKAAKDTLKDKPQDGSSGVKKGSRYGGSKQKDTPEQDDDKKKVNEAKRPEDDSVPFAPPFSSKPAETVDKSGAKHTPMSRAHHLARLAMGRVKKDLGQKGK